MTPAPRWKYGADADAEHAMWHALNDGALARNVDRYQAAMRAWWHTERPTLGRHAAGFPTTRHAHDEAA